MNWFKVNEKEYNVRIFEPKESFKILYSDNGGRTMEDGNPVVLDPLGTFFNYSMIIGSKKGYENDYEELWNLLSFPTNEPLLITFPSGRNSFWKTTTEDGREVNAFHANVSAGSRGVRKIIDKNGELEEVIYDAFSVDFMASKAQVLPI